MILEAFARALAKLDLRRAVAHALKGERDDTYRVIAIGKGSAAMFAGAKDALGARIEDSVVVTPEDAGHPLPDARSVRAGKRCLALASRRGDATVLVLVSGGASALVCVPAPGITLHDVRAVTRALLASGATVQDINVVRKHLSRIKGGGLARAAASRRVLTLIASDVIGGKPTDVASGPSVADSSTVAEARKILRHHAPAYASLPLVRTLAAHRGRARILVSPEHLARALGKELGARVLRPSQASASDLAREYVALAKRGSGAVVRAAEPSVVVPERGGKGGRCTHLAALVARDLPPGYVFAAIASDGVDGASGTAGAIVDASLREHHDIDAALARFDTGTLLRRAHAAIPARATGHNLTDVHVLLTPRRRGRGGSGKYI